MKTIALTIFMINSSNSELNGDLLACYQDSYFNHKFTIGAIYHKDSQSYSFHS